jgi:hypothetical protein
MKDLIVKSAIAKESNFEGYVINQLGKRFEKLTAINEKDCMKFKQKEWSETQEWREINDIL